MVLEASGQAVSELIDIRAHRMEGLVVSGSGSMASARVRTLAAAEERTRLYGFHQELELGRDLLQRSRKDQAVAVPSQDGEKITDPPGQGCRSEVPSPRLSFSVNPKPSTA